MNNLLHNKIDMRVFYRREIKNGQQLSFVDINPSIFITELKRHKYYLLIMFDPDAVGGNKIHWLIINISMDKHDCTIMPYIPPKPPKGSGYHHYIFYLIEYNNPIFVSKEFKIEFKNMHLCNLLQQFHISKFKIIDSFYFQMSYNNYFSITESTQE